MQVGLLPFTNDAFQGVVPLLGICHQGRQLLGSQIRQVNAKRTLIRIDSLSNQPSPRLKGIQNVGHGGRRHFYFFGKGHGGYPRAIEDALDHFQMQEIHSLFFEHLRTDIFVDLGTPSKCRNGVEQLSTLHKFAVEVL